MKGAAAAINASTASRICKQFSGRCFIAEFSRQCSQSFCYSFIIIENSPDAAGAVRINNKICTFAVGFDTFGIKFEHGFASAADQGTVGGFCVQQYAYIPVQKTDSGNTLVKSAGKNAVRIALPEIWESDVRKWKSPM